MKNLLKAGTVCGLAIFATLSTSNLNSAQACGPEPYVGTMCWTAANFCPRGYKRADNALYPISDYTMTYAVTGSTYGGDDRTVFGVPDTRARELVHAGQAPGLDMIYRGEVTGFDMTTIPYQYFPEHSHDIDLSSATVSASVIASNAPATELSPQDNYFANTTTTAPNYSTSENTLMAAGSVTADAEQGSGTISNTTNTPETQTMASALGPQIGLLACVAMDGLFPPRS